MVAPLLALAAAACVGSGDDGGPRSPGPASTAAAEQATASGRADLPGAIADATQSWNTEWSRRSIDLGELLLGIGAADPRDRIPPIDTPTFETVDGASRWLLDREPVLLLELEGEARGYPLQILTWHEIVNDEVGGTPIAVTYCPLCNSAVVFQRSVDGRVLRFGTSGLLRNSDLVMWDRQTESLWQQITGEAVVGELTGTRLQFLPSSIIRWKEFEERFPGGRVLSRQTGFERAYGSNPYENYDRSARPFLFNGEIDGRYPALERVVGVTVGETNKAYPFSVLSQERVVNDEVAGQPVLVLWGAPDTASALDSPDIAEGRSVGIGVAYLRMVNGRVLTFEPRGEDGFVDRETGSGWDILGKALEGPLVASELAPAVHANHFWFAWAAFFGKSPVYTGADSH